MNPLQLLMDEHRVIEQTIDALSVYARAVGNGANHPREDLAGLVAFIQGYADAHHHGKEEEILFRAMADNGMPEESGPLAVMLAEHREGRTFALELAGLAEIEGEWEEAQRQQLMTAAFGYAQLLREHIQKEDGILYPMADHLLPQDVWGQVEADFVAFEGAPENAERANRLKAIAHDLAQRYRS